MRLTFGSSQPATSGMGRVTLHCLPHRALRAQPSLSATVPNAVTGVAHLVNPKCSHGAGERLPHNVLVVSDPNQKFALTQDLDQVVNDAHQVFGDDPATVAAVLNSISIQLQEAGDYGAAEDLLNESVAIWQRTQGPQDSNVSVALTRLGRLLMLKGDEDAAEARIPPGYLHLRKAKRPDRSLPCCRPIRTRRSSSKPVRL